MPEEKKMRYGKCKHCVHYFPHANECSWHCQHVTDENGCYEFISPDEVTFNEIDIALCLYKKDDLYYIRMGNVYNNEDDVSIGGLTAEGVAENLKSYVLDYLLKLDK